MQALKSSHWVIEYTEPTKGGYSYNRSVGLICATAERAIEMFRTLSSEGAIHVVRRVGKADTLLIDPQLPTT